MWTPEEQHQFIAAIHAAQSDEEKQALAHQMADWFESVGKPAHAEVIRIHHNPVKGVQFTPGGLSNHGAYDHEDEVYHPHSGFVKAATVKRLLGLPDARGKKPGLSFVAFFNSNEPARLLHDALQQESR